MGDGGLDDLFHELLADKVVGHVGRMLGADNDGVDADRNHAAVIVLVGNGDLRLGVGAQPGAARLGVGVVADARHGLHEGRGQVVRHGHALLSLVGGVSKHEALVTGAHIVVVLANVNSGGNFGALLLNGNKHVASLVVEALVGRIVSDALDSVANNLNERERERNEKIGERMKN